MTDHDLQKRVEAELEWSPTIDATRIGVSVTNAVVTLSGAVRSYVEKVALERLIMNVRGVHGLAQEIDVRPDGPTGVDDDEIASRAVDRLAWDVMVPDDRIQVRVEDGRITLTGEVDWQFEREAAERAVRNLPGVLGFNDQVRLKHRTDVGDIRARITTALDRQANLDAGRVQIAVEGGEVSLTGNYMTWPDRAVIERAAWSSPGVSSVQDRMTLAT